MKIAIDELILDLVNESSPLPLGEFCENFKAEQLLGFLDLGYSPLTNRSRLCEFLGISESTLSGWITDNRIPHSAKVAIGLYILNQHQKSRINRLQNKLDNKDQFLIIKENGIYKLCSYYEEKDKTPVWQVIAGEINSIKDARLLSLTTKLLNQLSEISETVIDEMLDRTENDKYIKDLNSHKQAIIDTLTFINDPKKYFSPLSLDDI